MTSDCSMLVTSSHDTSLKTWYLTPRPPDPPQAPRVVAVTDTTAIVAWQSPPCFNEDVTAFHMQYRIGLKEKWQPAEVGFSIAPRFRSYVVKDLIAATPYQFRIRAENRMGLSVWSDPSRLVCTLYYKGAVTHTN
jgi:hypothetical protein